MKLPNRNETAPKEATAHPQRVPSKADADERQLGRTGDVVEVGPDHAVRLRAATTVLDRTGMGPTSTAEVNVTASLHLAALIAELDESGA